MSFTNNFHQHTLSSSSIKFAVEDLFPRAEVELPFGDRDDDFAAHDLPFHVGVGIIFAGSIVVILRGWRVRREFLEPDVVVADQSALVIVDLNAGGDVHSVYKAEAFLNATFANKASDGAGDIEVAATFRDFKPKMFRQRFHRLGCSLKRWLLK